MSQLVPSHYADVLDQIKSRVRSAQYDALRAVNKELIALYWDIGRIIVERQQGNTWGKSVVDRLARDLQTEFPGMQGFSARNLWRMRDFFLAHCTKDQILPPLVAEIAWSHNIVLLEKCKDPTEREFYLRMTKKFGWTRSVLIHQIENRTYEKTLLNQTNFDQALTEKLRHQAKLAVKDEYTFDFLELAEEHSERELEQAILLKIGPFLREMGGVFTFVGNQYRLEVGDREFFLDILLYHRRLKCLVALELKTGEFLPEYVGKMQFYLAVLDDTVRMQDEGPSIGIVLCKSKDRTIVEYALRESNKPIGVSAYRMVSVLPHELKGELPAPEQVARLLEAVTEV